MALQRSDKTVSVRNEIAYEISVAIMSQGLHRYFCKVHSQAVIKHINNAHSHLLLEQWGHNLTLWLYQNSPENTGFLRAALAEPCAFFLECHPALRTSVQELLNKTTKDAITQESLLRKHTEGKGASLEGSLDIRATATWSTIVQWQKDKQK